METVRGTSPLQDIEEEVKEEPNSVNEPEPVPTVTEEDRRRAYPFTTEAYQRHTITRRHSDQHPTRTCSLLQTYDTSETNLPRRFSEGEARKKQEVFADTDSDSEEMHNVNWESEMLVEELDRRNSIYAQESLREVETEMNTLKKVLECTNLDRLSPTELDALENIIDASDQKITTISDSGALDFQPRPEPLRKRRPHKIREKHGLRLDLRYIRGREGVLKKVLSCEQLKKKKKRHSRQSLHSLSPSSSSSDDFQRTSSESECEEERVDETAPLQPQSAPQQGAFAGTIGYLRRVSRRFATAVAPYRYHSAPTGETEMHDLDEPQKKSEEKPVDETKT